MSSCFLLVHTVPGREADVHHRIEALPSVAAAHVLFGGSIAVKLTGDGTMLEQAARDLTRVDGVVQAAFYRTRKNT